MYFYARTCAFDKTFPLNIGKSLTKKLLVMRVIYFSSIANVAVHFERLRSKNKRWNL